MRLSPRATHPCGAVAHQGLAGRAKSEPREPPASAAAVIIALLCSTAEWVASNRECITLGTVSLTKTVATVISMRHAPMRAVSVFRRRQIRPGSTATHRFSIWTQPHRQPPPPTHHKEKRARRACCLTATGICSAQTARLPNLGEAEK